MHYALKYCRLGHTLAVHTVESSDHEHSPFQRLVVFVAYEHPDVRGHRYYCLRIVKIPVFAREKLIDHILHGISSLLTLSIIRGMPRQKHLAVLP